MATITTLVDRVKIISLSSGTGAFEFGPAVDSYRGVEALIDGATYNYAAAYGANYEVGTGLYVESSNTLVRTPVLSSNGNAAVAFPANTEIAFTITAADITPEGSLPIVQSTGTSEVVAMSQDATTDALAAIASDIAGKANSAALAAPGGGALLGFIQSGAGAVAQTIQSWARKLIHQSDYSSYANAKTAAGSSYPLIATPNIDSGLTAAKTRPGYIGGHINISQAGDDRTDNHAFVGVLGDEKYGDTAQEVRGISYTVRNYRTTPDEATLGWDFFGVAGNVVVESANTQYIRGNMKAVVGELYFFTPASGAYTVLTAHNYQSVTEVYPSVTVTNWYGYVVSPPHGGGTITNGYGVYIQSLAGGATPVVYGTAAAIKIDGVDNYGQIKWANCRITEDSSGKLTIGLNSKQLVFENAMVETSATTGAASALPGLPSGYLRVLIGGSERRIPYYEP